MDFPWNHHRRFNSYAEYFQREFGARVQKLTLDAGFSCPNRDADTREGGCTYCNNDAFNPSYCSPTKSITQQLQEGVAFHRKRYRRAKMYLAYFQAYSNTFAGIDKLKTLYEEALSFPGVTGLVIGTRPDCINDEILDYLAALKERYYIIIEYGVESHKEDTLLKINRGHTFKQSEEAIKRTANKGINTGAHMILGLPGENRDDMLEGSKRVSKLPISTIKMHQLQIVSGTKMAEEFKLSPELFRFFSLTEYIDLVIDYMELLNPFIVVERFAGEVPPRFLVGPGFGLIRNDQILIQTEKRMEERNTYQGRLFV